MTDPQENLTTENTGPASSADRPLTIHEDALLLKRNTLLNSRAHDEKDTPVSQSQAAEREAPLISNDTGIPVDMPREHARPEGLIRTFKEDVQDLIKNQKLSMTKIKAIESDARVRETPYIERTVHQSSFVSIVFSTFLALGIVVAGTWYYTVFLQTTLSSQKTLAYGLLFTEGYEQVDITNKVPRAAREAFALVRKRGAFSIGSLIELVPTARVRDEETGDSIPTRASSKELVRALGFRVPALFIETLGPLYMSGLHVGDENIPFLILTTTSYDHAFSGMLSWEKSIEEDLAPFMSPQATYTPPATAQGSQIFIDTVVRNFDIRILRDETGAIRILYGFADRNTIIITTRVETFLSIAERLRVEKQ